MLEMFSHGFMVRAIIAGLIVGTALAILSTPVALKKLSFMGVGLSHSAFGGVAIGLLIGVNVTSSALLFCVVVSLVIGWLSRRGGLREDVSIGVLFSASMAIGAVCLGLMEGVSVDLFSYLFGSILAVTADDLLIAGLVLAMIVAIFTLLYKQILVYCFDEDWARVSGVNIDRLQDLLFVMIAICVVVSMKLLGIVLVSALLVIPGAVGYMLASTMIGQYGIAIITSNVSILVGLAISYQWDIAPGAAIVLSASAIFLATTIFGTKPAATS